MKQIPRSALAAWASKLVLKMLSRREKDRTTFYNNKFDHEEGILFGERVKARAREWNYTLLEEVVLFRQNECVKNW